MLDSAKIQMMKIEVEHAKQMLDQFYSYQKSQLEKLKKSIEGLDQK